MSYSAKILADSVSPDGHRLTTFELTFPRFILAEINTHRMLSKNSASSRAIPTEILIKRVKDHPFIPETFNKRVKGMGVGEKFDAAEAGLARTIWLDARDRAVQAAQILADIKLDKSRANRLLEPFMWHTAIISGTDWENFFNLRQPQDGPVPNFDFPAQPEFQIIARMARDLYESNEPNKLEYGEWHLPLVSKRFDRHDDKFIKAAVSAGRCAKVSYDRHTDNELPNNSAERWYKLREAGHWSPAEHPAMAVDDGYIGNFKGFKQFRKFYPEEAVFRNITSDE